MKMFEQNQCKPLNKNINAGKHGINADYIRQK